MRADALRNEADFLPDNLADLVELRRQVIDAGYAPQVASGIVGWLLAKWAGDPDPTSSDTRANYRKVLAELGGGTDPARSGRPEGPGDAGQAPSPPQWLTAENARYAGYVNLRLAA